MPPTANNNPLTPRELEAAPELAALAVLDATIDTTIDVLFAVDPGLADDERPYWIDRSHSQRILQRILVLASHLQDAIAQHRDSLKY